VEIFDILNKNLFGLQKYSNFALSERNFDEGMTTLTVYRSEPQETAH